MFSIIKTTLIISGWILCLGGIGTMDIRPEASIAKCLIIIITGMFFVIAGMGFTKKEGD